MKRSPLSSEAGGAVRISDLSRQSGVSVATIKFYVRERLVPPGTPTARNQADYNEHHLRRIRFIRTLTLVGRLDLSSVRELLAVIDDDQVGLPGLFDVFNRTLFADPPDLAGFEGVDRAREEVEGFLDGLGWDRAHRSRGHETLVHVLAALRSLGCAAEVDFFTPFALAAERVTTAELSLRPSGDPVKDKAVAVVRGVLFDAAFAALRRMSRERLVIERAPDDRYGC